MNVFYSGEAKGQSAMHYFQDIGPRVIHTYNIINQGKWHIRNLQVKILWPYQVKTDRKEGGKWLLYLERQPLIDSNIPHFCTVSPENVINPLKTNSSGNEDLEEPPESNEVHVRKRRDVATVVPAETKVEEDGKVRKIVKMNCRKTAACAEITCTIPKLVGDEQIPIRIFSRLWNSTLIEDYSQVDWVTIESEARVIINEPGIKLTNDSVTEALVIF